VASTDAGLVESRKTCGNTGVCLPSAVCRFFGVFTEAVLVVFCRSGLFKTLGWENNAFAARKNAASKCSLNFSIFLKKDIDKSFEVI
jgi:hypothetical protein